MRNLGKYRPHIGPYPIQIKLENLIVTRLNFYVRLSSKLINRIEPYNISHSIRKTSHNDTWYGHDYIMIFYTSFNNVEIEYNTKNMHMLAIFPGFCQIKRISIVFWNDGSNIETRCM